MLFLFEASGYVIFWQFVLPRAFHDRPDIIRRWWCSGSAGRDKGLCNNRTIVLFGPYTSDVVALLVDVIYTSEVT